MYVSMPQLHMHRCDPTHLRGPISGFEKHKYGSQATHGVTSSTRLRSSLCYLCCPKLHTHNRYMSRLLLCGLVELATLLLESLDSRSTFMYGKPVLGRRSFFSVSIPHHSFTRYFAINPYNVPSTLLVKQWEGQLGTWRVIRMRPSSCSNWAVPVHQDAARKQNSPRRSTSPPQWQKLLP